jgi:hypothetical protein
VNDHRTTPLTLGEMEAARERAAVTALTLLGAPSANGAADTYLPTRLYETMRRLHGDGQRAARPHLHLVLATMGDLLAVFPRQIHGSLSPLQPDQERSIEEAIKGVMLHRLGMREPWPNRHVAFFTHQLRGALEQAWQQGYNLENAAIAAAGKALAKARRSLDATHISETQRIAYDAARTLSDPFDS